MNLKKLGKKLINNNKDLIVNSNHEIEIVYSQTRLSRARLSQHAVRSTISRWSRKNKMLILSVTEARLCRRIFILPSMTR